jgi:hypothetical protein
MKCRAKSKAGKPCCAPCVGDTNCCVMHSGRAAELGRKGGLRRTVYSPEGLKEFSAPKSAADLRDLLAQSIVEIRTGKLDPKLANSISYLGTGFLRAMELADLERRLTDLENVMELGKAALLLGKEEVYEGFEKQD